MLATKYRFHGHGSLRYVYSKGKVVRSDLFVLKYSLNPRRTRPRIAVVVSKKIAKSAVSRNRIRRRYYEAMRRRLPHLDIGCDIVLIITSPASLFAEANEIEAKLEASLRRTDLYSADKN